MHHPGSVSSFQAIDHVIQPSVGPSGEADHFENPQVIYWWLLLVSDQQFSTIDVSGGGFTPPATNRWQTQARDPSPSAFLRHWVLFPVHKVDRLIGPGLESPVRRPYFDF